ncbi:hypothetical protein Bca52824_069711 [Brassica carinata]|uniref:peroxidase n=1 Tax=Brassica carinata TaxID=52824 RepID=A0A8X7Q4U1_BRACI|nr:hypothetical protein Bca52824_069711 [Brassica carinata]
MASNNLFIAILAIVVTLSLQGDNNNVVQAQLTTNFYSTSCPNLLSTVRSTVKSAVDSQPRTGASILRLFFHDCFVNLGGPNWNVKVGRRDARTASQAAANSNIPAPTSSLSQLISSFSAVGLSTRDMVALSGAHTIGQSRCTNFRTRVYNETNINAAFATLRQRSCPRAAGSGDGNLAPLDVNSANSFDNSYFKNLVAQRGLLHSDQELFNGGSTDSIVTGYSNNPASFSSDFTAAMIKMGDISPLTGSSGEIRKVCGRTN